MKNAFLIILMSSILSGAIAADKPKGIYQILIYHFQTQEQENNLDTYLSKTYLPFLHRSGIKQVGVFKPVGNDTTADKKIYVLIPHKSLKAFQTLGERIKTDKDYQTSGADYLNAGPKQPVFKRMENILLQNFDPAMGIRQPKLKNNKAERIYELRSYESPSEKLHINKLHMFIEGEETDIFDEINANPIFYGSVIAGSTMPNLMYMTSFESKADRDATWKVFGAHPQWQKLKSMDFYKGNVSKNVIVFLKGVEYSDL